MDAARLGQIPLGELHQCTGHGGDASEVLAVFGIRVLSEVKRRTEEVSGFLGDLRKGTGHLSHGN